VPDLVNASIGLLWEYVDMFLCWKWPAAYLVVADEEFGRQIPFAFLDRVKEDFKRRYLSGNGAVTPAVGKEFGPQLKEHMQYCVEHPEEMNKISKIKSQVAEVKGIMMDNIEKVLDRGEKIELLVDKTENLRSQVSIVSLCHG
jgi:vesicle-associated membrane protein 72